MDILGDKVIDMYSLEARYGLLYEKGPGHIGLLVVPMIRAHLSLVRGEIHIFGIGHENSWR